MEKIKQGEMTEYIWWAVITQKVIRESNSEKLILCKSSEGSQEMQCHKIVCIYKHRRLYWMKV